MREQHYLQNHQDIHTRIRKCTSITWIGKVVLTLIKMEETTVKAYKYTQQLYSGMYPTIKWKLMVGGSRGVPTLQSDKSHHHFDET